MKLYPLRLLALVAALLAASPDAALAARVCRGAVFLENIPAREESAPTGSEFARRTASLSDSERQTAALDELRRGNIPAFARRLQPVTVTEEGRTVTFWVMPDYLAIGSDRDFLRIPLSLPSALAIAEEFGATLPTPKMVDLIYAEATIKLRPQPLPASDEMRSNDYFLRHQFLIQAQLGRRRLGELVAGHKKDVVLSSRLLSHPGRVAIYGWHRGSGLPIQPLSTAHGAWYADYSHGVRLVSPKVLIDGELYSIYDVLNNQTFAKLLSCEGPVVPPATLLAMNR